MEPRGTPVSVNNTRGDFAGELTIPECTGTRRWLRPTSLQSNLPVSAGCKGIFALPGLYSRVACTNPLLCGLVSLGRGHLLSLGKKLSSGEDKVIDRVFFKIAPSFLSGQEYQRAHQICSGMSSYLPSPLLSPNAACQERRHPH